MSFLSPIYFWAFLALIPLIGIYFLKVRPRRKPTAAFFLWEKIFEEKRTTALFQRLRDLFSLLLLALAFSAIALALTKPEIVDDERKDLLLVVDQSASMNAGVGTSSLDRAKGKARDLIQGLRGNQRAAVASVSHELKFHSHLTDNPRALLEAIDAIEPTMMPLNPRALTRLQLRTTQGTEGNHRVLFLTDGAGDQDVFRTSIDRWVVGEALQNVGIVAADLQVLPSSEERLGLYFQLASSFQETKRADLTVKRVDTGAIAKLIEVTVTPGVNEPEVYTLEEAQAGSWIIELEIEDALAGDNRAHVVAQQSPPVQIQVDTADGYFFQNAVLAFERGGGLALVEKEPDLVLAKAATPDAELSLIFQPDGSSPWWGDLGDDVVEIVPKVLLKEHPALRYVDPTAMRFVGARELVLPEDALSLVESDLGVPLIYLVRRDGKSAVVVNMDPLASEFYFSAWFPVLVHGVATYLSGREEALVASYGTGQTVKIPGHREGEPTSVRSPGGDEQTLASDRFGPIREIGFHEVMRADETWRIGVSLLNTSETLLGPAESQVDLEAIAFGPSLAWWLTVLAILVLVIESLLYQRRKVG